jgi:hypothetical protein
MKLFISLLNRLPLLCAKIRCTITNMHDFQPISHLNLVSPSLCQTKTPWNLLQNVQMSLIVKYNSHESVKLTLGVPPCSTAFRAYDWRLWTQGQFYCSSSGYSGQRVCDMGMAMESSSTGLSLQRSFKATRKTMEFGELTQLPATAPMKRSVAIGNNSRIRLTSGS